MIDVRGTLLDLLRGLADRRKAVASIATAVVVLAVVALYQMPVQLLPEIRYPHIRIIADLPGQTSRVIEESVNEPLEAALAGVSGLVQLQSRSGDSRAYFELFFEPAYDLDRALRDVTQAAQRAQAQMPPEMPPPRIFEVSTTQQPALEFAFGSPELSSAQIRQRLRSYVLPRLRALPGVDAVYMGHSDISELVVDVDPHAQAASGVSLNALEALLLEATEPPLSSAMRTGQFEGVGVLGTDTWDVQQLQQRPVLLDTGNGAVALRSIATVHNSPSQESVRTRLDGNPAVLVTVYRSPRAHSLRLSQQAHAVVEQVSATSAFANIHSTVLFDDTVVTRSAVQSVIVAAVGGAVLAIALLFFGLRRHRRYVPLVAVVVGVSLSAAIIALYAMGQSLNLLTLAGLLLSVGLGLDYAIIYFDRLDRIRHRSDEPHLHAMADVTGPLLGALLTTVAAVLPFLLVQGLIALLFRPLIYTVVAAGIFCFLFALLLLPSFARLSPAPADEPAAVVRSDRRRRWWSHAQRTPVAWSAAAVLGVVLVVGGRALPFEVLPVVDDGFVRLSVTYPVGITTDTMDEMTRSVEAQIMALDGTEALFTTVGGYFREGLPAFRPARSDFMARVNTQGGDLPSAEWAARVRAAVDSLAIPNLRLSVTLPRIRGVQTRLADADIVVVLTAEDGDLLALGEIESQVMDLLDAVPGLSDVERLRAGVSPRWVVQPRYDVLADYAVQPAAIRQVLDYALEGRVLRQRMQSGEPLVLRARYDRRYAGGPHLLDELRVPAGAGAGSVHLGDVAEFTYVEEPTHIERREGQRVIRVAGQLDPAGPGPGVVADRVGAALAGANLPSGVGWWLEGEIEALEETGRTFTLALILALAMVLMLLVAQYGSVTFALAGLLSIGLCTAGAVIMLAVMDRSLDAMVLAGLLIAVGIVANNVILVLSQAQAALDSSARTASELSITDALGQAGRDRFRPIMLTVMSTVLGISPLLFGGAEVFGLLQPLAIALTGTLLLSIPVACLMLPGIATSLRAFAPRRSENWQG